MKKSQLMGAGVVLGVGAIAYAIYAQYKKFAGQQLMVSRYAASAPCPPGMLRSGAYHGGGGDCVPADTVHGSLSLRGAASWGANIGGNPQNPTGASPRRFAPGSTIAHGQQPMYRGPLGAAVLNMYEVTPNLPLVQRSSVTMATPLPIAHLPAFNALQTRWFQ